MNIYPQSLTSAIEIFNPFVDNEYSKEYMRLILEYKNYEKVIGETESHHVLPKSCFPQFNTSSWNLVNVPYEIHLRCHELLPNMFVRGSANQLAMSRAWKCCSITNGDRNSNVTPDEFSKLRNLHSIAAKESAKSAVDDGTHNFIGSSNNKRRLEIGTHPSQVSRSCPHCGIVGMGAWMLRDHMDNCKSNPNIDPGREDYVRDYRTKQSNSRSRYWGITNPDGEYEVIHNLEKYCRENTLTATAMGQVAKGKLPHHKKYKCVRL